MAEVLVNLIGLGGDGSSDGSDKGLAMPDPTNVNIINSDSSAIIMWTDPNDIIIDGQNVARWAGTLVVRKEGSAPNSKSDGVVVVDSKQKNQYSQSGFRDTGLVNGTQYYYGIFPYTTQNVYNYLTTVQFTPTGVLIYGFRQNFNDIDPATTISYISGTENANYAAMMTNTGTGAITYGGWEKFLSDVLFNKPAMVTRQGLVDYWLDPNDYTKKLDGSASDVSNVSYDGAGAFAWLEKCYMKEIYSEDESYRDVYFAFNGKPDETYTPVGFVDGDGNELSGVWIPMFYQNSTNEKSIGGTSEDKSRTTDTQKTIIDYVGSRARFLGGPMINILRDLEYMMFKSTDIQKQAGSGNCSGGSASALKHNVVVNNDDTHKITGWKGSDSKTDANKYFHSMCLGTYDQWQRDPYIQLVNGKLMVSPNYEYNIGGTGYVDTGKTRASADAWQYPTKMEKIDGFGSIYKQDNVGSQNTGSCDGHYYNASGTRVAFRFGSCDGGLVDGPASLSLSYEASFAGWGGGASLLLLPPAGYDPKETCYKNGVKIVSFQNGTDDEITAMLEAHYAGKIDIHDYWSVGDARTIHLSAMPADGVGESHVEQDATFVILHGAGMFDLVEGGKNTFVVGMKHVLSNGDASEDGYINPNNTNIGGWKNSARRVWCDNVFRHALPEKVMKWFKAFTYKASAGGQSTNIDSMSNYFTLASEYEIFGNKTYSVESESDTQMDFYRINTANRLKKTNNGLGYANGWWERSPYASDSAAFCRINGGGGAAATDASVGAGFLPFGCI